MLKTVEVVQGTELEEEQKRQGCSVCLFLALTSSSGDTTGWWVLPLGSAELGAGNDGTCEGLGRMEGEIDLLVLGRADSPDLCSGMEVVLVWGL